MLVEILEAAGMRGAELAHAYLWVAESTMGCLVNEATLSYADQVEGARNVLDEMSEEARRHHAALVPHLARLDADAFIALVADHTIAALPERSGRGATRKPRR